MKYWPWYVALGLVTFILVAGGVVGSRLSEQTLAFMAGVIFGGIAALPIGAVIGWAVKVAAPDRSGVHPAAAHCHHDAAEPIQVCRARNAYSAAQQVVSAAPSARREFTTIGEEEIVYHESESVW